MQLKEIDNKLADSSVYEKQNKATLALLLQEQTKYKQQLEEKESNWLSLQQKLENITNNTEN